MKVSDQPITFMETRLTWMKENQPELLLELHKKGELGRNLFDMIQEAKAIETELEQKNLNEDQVEEMILDFLAPAEGMDLYNNKADRIPEKLFNKIVRQTLP